MAAKSQNSNGSQPAQPDLIPVKGNMRLKKGVLITFEGGEGAGKTTQATRLATRLSALGFNVEHAREPGGTRIGEEVRAWVKREGDTTVVADTLLFAAARAQLVHDVIRPKLRREAIVIVDRFIDSTIAYQGYGLGMDIDQIRTVNEIATGGLEPDLTVFLDSDPEIALSRVSGPPSLFEGSEKSSTGHRTDREEERRFERQPMEFHEKVRKGFQELAAEGDRWSVIRADQAQHRVADAIWKRVRSLLIEHGIDPEPLFRKQGASKA